MPREVPIWQVDAFADAVFAGNPAAIVPLDAWLPEEMLLRIAAENNLAETAFLVEAVDGYLLRWFTPTIEVELCGHATLAAARIVFDFLKPGTRRVVFATVSAGPLVVTDADGLLTLDLPARPPSPIDPPIGLAEALGNVPETVLGADKLLAVFASAAEVAGLAPDFRRLAALAPAGLIASAPGEAPTDFVSRFFAPAMGIDEDPVTGSAHCVLVPYWAQRLGRTKLAARQISARGGSLVCEDRGERVALSGRAQLYLAGRIFTQ